jgi:hypothetical protein
LSNSIPRTRNESERYKRSARALRLGLSLHSQWHSILQERIVRILQERIVPPLQPPHSQRLHRISWDSVILDSGATTHVFNAAHWFKGNIEPTNIACYTGKGVEPITGFGTAKISLESSNGVHYATLSDAAYIPRFNINIVSLRKLNAKGVFWNNERNFLYSLEYGREVIWAKLEEKEGQNILQFHEPKDAQTEEIDISAYFTQPRIARPPTRGAYSARPVHLQPSVTALGLLWHRRLGHAGPKAIQKLTAAVL